MQWVGRSFPKCRKEKNMSSWFLTDPCFSGGSDWSQRGYKASASKTLHQSGFVFLAGQKLLPRNEPFDPLCHFRAFSSTSELLLTSNWLYWDRRSIKTKWAAVFLWQSHHPASTRSETVLQTETTRTNQGVCLVLKRTSIHFQSCWAGAIINSLWKYTRKLQIHFLYLNLTGQQSTNPNNYTAFVFYRQTLG